ncbi:MAG TPA: tripartite tricarboxylate transporter substrate binding protein [Burkholderiaceae bacterium]|nr:tripartite tricarboxylate transporter substrate binding protein [Burkholderiaceae bacterium]
MNRRTLLKAIALAGPGVAQAQSPVWPSRPVRVIVPYAAGGGPDLLARKMAPELARALGVNVVVENKVGAAGIVAAEVSALAPPDGYLVLLGSSSHIVHKILQPGVKFDPLTSFSPITTMARGAGVLVVPSDTPWRTAQDLAAAIRAKPGRFNYASGGVGTAAHLAGASFVRSQGLHAVHIPYRGSVEIVPALLGGDVHFAFPVSSTAMPAIRSGKVRPLAVAGGQRIRSLPDVPTLSEIYKDERLVHEFWTGAWVPAGTPRDVIDKLDAAFKAAHRVPAVREFYEANGSEVVFSDSPAQFADLMKRETDKWTRIIQLTGVKPE